MSHVANMDTRSGDALAARARDAASVGLVVFPVITHLYSVALLLTLHASALPMTYQGRKTRREAWALDLTILAGAALCAGILLATKGL